jgi:hypothetical protein
LKIDLHIHTRFSGDALSEPEEVVLHAIKNGLDGIAFTEHYYYEASEHADRLREKYGDRILIFRGVEYSAEEGHCLIFGIDTDRALPRNAPVSEIIPIVNGSGGVIIPTHPYRVSNSMGEAIRALQGIHAIEGQNGYSHHSQNVKAQGLAEEMSLPFTGGSDAHEAHEVGACYTEFDDAVTYDNFIELIRRGNYRGVDTRKISRAWVF